MTAMGTAMLGTFTMLAACTSDGVSETSPQEEADAGSSSNATPTEDAGDRSTIDASSSDSGIDAGGNPVGKKRLFLTDAVVDGNIGGNAGGDAICQKEANDAKLGGVWRAYLSADVAAKDHIESLGPWFLLDGTLAFEEASPHASAPKQALNLTPTGERPTGNGAVNRVGVRTGSDSSGDFNINAGKAWTCARFTSASNDERGGWGNALSPDAWNDVISASDDPSAICGVKMRLYCFEQ